MQRSYFVSSVKFPILRSSMRIKPCFRASFWSFLIFFMIDASAQSIWNDTTITFTKVDGADWTLEENQDRITSNVWLTRQNGQLLFNIKNESRADSISPLGTKWAYGNLNNWNTLTFKAFKPAIGSIRDALDKDLVVYLEQDDIYLQLKITKWTSGQSGGGFEYERSTSKTATLNRPLAPKIKIRNTLVNSHIILDCIDDVSNATFKVLNASGVMFDITNNFNNTANSINCTDLSNGNYFLLIETDQKYKYQKFTKIN